MKIIIKILFIITLLGTQWVCAQEGTLRWKYNTGGSIINDPAIGNDSSIYFINENFYALYPNGTMNWSMITPDNVFMTTPVVAPDGTIYENVDYSLAAFNPNGTVKWSTSVYSYSEELGDQIALGADGTIYMSGLDTTLRAFDSSGNQKWKINLLIENIGLAVTRSNGTIYVASNSYDTDFLYAINPNGTIAWKVGSFYPFGYGISLDKRGNIYIGSWDGNLYCFTPWGTLKWKYLTGGDVIADPVFGADGTIYFGSEDSYLYALNSEWYV